MNATESAPPRNRILALDALRGVAVFLMIEQHVGIWMWRGPARGQSIMDYTIPVAFNALGGMAAPLFVSLAGVGSALFTAKARPGIDATLIRRGLVLMGFGYILNLLVPSWFAWGSWFVLHMMGFAMLLGPLWRRLSDRGLLIACVAVLVLSVIVQQWLRTPVMMGNERMRDVSLPGGALRLALAEGQFPILPWLTFYLAGTWAGRRIYARQPGKVAALGITCLAIGGGGVLVRALVGPGSPWLDRAFGLHLGFFPASTGIVLLLLGGALLLQAFVVWIDQRGRGFDERHPLVTLGRASLTLLMLHVVLFRELSRPIGWWHGFSPGPALVVVLVFVAIAVVLTRWWQRIDYRGGAEWLLRRVAG